MDRNFKTQIETLTPSPAPSSSPSQFAFAITRTAVAQICQDSGFIGSKESALKGFRGSNESALQTLTHIATVYLQSLAKIAAAHATDANRTDCNLFDVILALEELAPVQGLRGASSGGPKKSLLSCGNNKNKDEDADGHKSPPHLLVEYILAVEDLFSVQGVRDNKSLLSSTTLVDIMKFVVETEERPFAKPIPGFNSSRRRRNLPRKNKKGVSARDYLEQMKHIPRWLPPFPDPSTYEIRRRDIRFSKTIDDCDNSSKQLDSLRNCVGDALSFDDDLSAKGSDIIIARRNCQDDKEEREKSELLPEKRGRVRFKMGLEREGLMKMGVNLRNGVCRGGGGKRICFEQARHVFFGVEN